jgi:hypothetical protein
MPARTDLDRLAAARPAVLHRTEDVVDPAAEDRILHHIMSSAPEAPALGGTTLGGTALDGAGSRGQGRLPGSARPAARRPGGRKPRAVALALTSAAAVIVAAVAAVITLTPGSHAPARSVGSAGHHVSRPARAQLADWTVTKLADGQVRVHIIELRDPAALQAKLRAAGVPANVNSSGFPVPVCRVYLATPAQLGAIFAGSIIRGPIKNPDAADIVIHLASLPHGTGLEIVGRVGPSGGVAVYDLVYASSACTGS